MSTFLSRCAFACALVAAGLALPHSGVAQQMPAGTEQTPSGADPDNPTPGSMDTPPTVSGSGRGGQRPAVHEGDGPPRMPPRQQRGRQPSKTPTGETISVDVNVRHGVEDRPIADTGVVLRASRPRGPFEPDAPEPRREWTAATDETGEVRFDEIPKRLANSGLELYAVTTYGGVTFESGRVPPSDGSTLELDVYEMAPDASSVRVRRLRTIVEPWEDYLVFTQFWTIGVEGDRAVDTTSLGKKKYEKGLPLELPLQAEGIKASGRGETEVVDSTVYWKGVLKPERTVSFQVRFSMPASSPSFVYEQTVDYPVDRVDVALPLKTNYKKIPRLDEAELAAPGFERVEATRSVPGLRRNLSYLYATGKQLEAGESFAFRLDGLPFEHNYLPWIVLGLGLVGAGGIFVFARRERREMRSDETHAEAIATLEEEHERLLDELALLEEDYESGEVDEVDYEAESLRLREQLTLVADKLEELRED